MTDVALDYELNKSDAFQVNPNQHNRAGYITNLRGFGLAAPLVFKADIKCYCGFNQSAPTYPNITMIQQGSQTSLAIVQVVAILEKFSWGGGTHMPLHFEMLMSQENAKMLKDSQQATLTTTRVDEFGWWIFDYDQEKKCWFEQSYPLSKPTFRGHCVPRDNPVLDVNLQGESVVEGTDQLMYKVIMDIGPGMDDLYGIFHANSVMSKQNKPWGGSVGTWAAASFS